MIPPNRVLQLDSLSLDNQIYSDLESKLSNALTLSNNLKYLNHFKLLLKLLIFKFTIWDNDTSYGLSLFNLLIANSTNSRSSSNSTRKLPLIKKYLLLSSIILNHLLSNFESFIYSYDDDDDENEDEDNGHNTSITHKTFKKLISFIKSNINKFQNSIKLLSFVNFLIFLLNGKFPNLLTRIFNIQFNKINPINTSSNFDNISYEFQNRQLIWNTLTEFLIFIKPNINLLNLNSLSYFNKKDSNISTQFGNAANDYKFLPERVCAICYQNANLVDDDENNKKNSSGTNTLENLITNPYETNCGHVYCYVCLINKLEIFKRKRMEMEGKNKNKKKNNNNANEINWSCLRCGEEVKWGKVYDKGCEEFFKENIEEVSESESESESNEESSENEDSEASESESESNEESSENEDSEASESGNEENESSTSEREDNDDFQEEAYDYDEETFME